MAIVDDYPAIAAELRRLRATRRHEGQNIAERQEAGPVFSARHPMRVTPAGEYLYRRLVARRSQKFPGS
jgi:hypothetical protein